MDSDIVLLIIIGSALAFDFTNGFHDTANSIATSISTRALTPRVAVILAAALNFAGAFISVTVAETITLLINKDALSGSLMAVVFGGLIGAIFWNLVTWYFGLPSSSSHALIGGLIGAGLVAGGTGAINGPYVFEKVLTPAVVAPILALIVTYVAVLIIYRIVGRQHPGHVTRGFRLGQILSGSMLALSHGTNDAQKTMGIIVLALVANGSITESAPMPTWVKVAAATAIALGTYAGGWRIIRTMGTRIIKMDPAQGFATQGAGAAVILSASHVGFPLSTTHVITGGVMGAGVGKRISAVRWGVAGNIVVAWVVTFPAAAVMGGLIYGLVELIGEDMLGPLLVAVALLLALLFAFGRRLRAKRALAVEGQ